MNLFAHYADYAHALLRIMAGFMFSLHGAQKLFGVFTDTQPPLWSQIGIGGVIELVGGILILAGYRTRVAAFLCSGMMAVAYVQFHWKFQMGPGFLPLVNRGELAVLYCFVFLLIACRGAGPWGFDRRT